MTPTLPSSDPACCPLCGQDNNCQLCSPETYKGQCWCAAVKFPDALLQKIPPESRNKACVCLGCVKRFNEQNQTGAAQKVLPGDFYFDPQGLMVFTADYHLRRGYCCNSGCRHCPF